MSDTSKTALLVIRTLQRNLQQNKTYYDFFGDKYYQYLNQLIDQAYNKEQYTNKNIMWMYTKLMFNLPNKIQSSINNTCKFSYEDSIVVRKIMIYNEILKSINNSFQQICILGGGYDITSIMLSQKYPHITFFEMDKGATQKRKIEIMESIFPFKTDNMHFVECDLIFDDISNVLSSSGFCFDKKTLVIAEGLTMYLQESIINKTLKTLANILTIDSKLILSIIPNAENTGFVNTILNRMLKSSQENYNFFLHYDNVQKFMNENGFYVDEKMSILTVGKYNEKLLKKNTNVYDTFEPYYICSLTMPNIIMYKFIDIPEINMH